MCQKKNGLTWFRAEISLLASFEQMQIDQVQVEFPVNLQAPLEYEVLPINNSQ